MTLSVGLDSVFMWSNLQARFEFLRSCWEYCVVYLELSISTTFKQLSSNVIHTRSFDWCLLELSQLHQPLLLASVELLYLVQHRSSACPALHHLCQSDSCTVHQFIMVFFAICLEHLELHSEISIFTSNNGCYISFLIFVRFLTVLYRLFWVFAKIVLWLYQS